MTLEFRYTWNAIIFLLLWMETPITATDDGPICPIGFSLFHRKDKGPLCFRRKGPERFADKYKDCVGNLYTSKIYEDVNLNPDYTVWSEYKSMHPGGFFVDWSYTDSMGDKFDNVYDVAIDPSLDLEEELCLVIDPVSNYTAAKCNEQHYSFCVVKPYVNKYTSKGCKDLKDSLRFWSPESTCLTVLSGVGGGNVRATWNQAQDLCSKKGGSLLHRGWRYSNHPRFRDVGVNHVYPLGVVMSSDFSMLRYDAMDDHSEIPDEEWNFEQSFPNTETLLGSVHDNFWDLVNSSYIFYDVLCERTVPMKNISLEVSVDFENRLTLTVNDSLDKDDIYCFTDSVSRFPAKVSKSRVEDTNTFILKPKQDGYYWCTHTNTKNYVVTESKKVLFIREKQSVVNNYAIKLRHYELYKLDDTTKLFKMWEMKLTEYIYLRNKYESIYGDINNNVTEDTLRSFRSTNPSLDFKDKSIILKIKVKRLYMDRRSVLVHVELSPDMKPVIPGYWENIEIVSMKPVYYCKAFDTIPQLPLGNSTSTAGCRTHTCVGDFNEGVQWVTTATDNCTPRSRMAVNRDLQIVNVTVQMPTVPPITTSYHLSVFEDDRDSSEEERGTEIIYTTQEPKPPKPTPTTYPNGVITITDSPFTNHTVTVTTPDTVYTTTTTVVETNATTPCTTTTTSATTTRPVAFPEMSEDVTIGSLHLLILAQSVSNEAIQLVFNKHSPRFTSSFFSSNVSFLAALVLLVKNWDDNDTILFVYVLFTNLQPEEKLQQVIDDLDHLVNNGSIVLVDDIVDVFNQVDFLLDVNDTLEIPGQLLHLLDKLGSAIELNGSQSAAAVRGNIALILADAQPDNPVRGLKIATRDSDLFTDEAFQILTDEPNSTVLDSERSEVVVNLPQSVSESFHRISFVVFRNDRAFQPSDGLYSVNSRVLSIKIGNVTQFENGEVIDIHLSPITTDVDRNLSRTCAFWEFMEDGTGYWSTEGCRFIKSGSGALDVCRCTHLTHFAEVLFPRSVFSEKNESALELLTMIGCFLSIFGLILVGITAALFRSWRRDFSNKIWLQLCISIFILALTFVIIIFAKFDGYNVFCMLTGIFLHYSVLSSFCWMLVAAIISYRRLVLVFTRDASHKLLRAAAFSWGAPFAVIGILLSIAPHSYSGRFEEKSPSSSFCYPSGLSLWLSVYTPIAFILLVNWTLFGLIVRSVFASRRIQRHGDSNEALRCASVSCLLVFLFGLPWLFGLFAFNVIAAYLFTLTATYQGFMLFLFFVLGNKKTRDLWLNKLKIKQTRKVPVTSSTYSNRSTGWRGATQNPTMEAKASKPKSLNQDDSRFS